MNRTLNMDELKFFYRKHWIGTNASFARLYHINAGNFSRFLLNKKRSQASQDAIRVFIEEYNNPKLCEQEKLENISFEDDNNNNLKLVSSPLLSLNKIEKKVISMDSLNKLAFIDGDQSHPFVRELESWWDKSENKDIFQDLFVIVFMRLGSKLPTTVYNIPFICACYSHSGVRDAVDNTISIATTRLNMVLCLNTEFSIITMDKGFTPEPIIYLENMGRRCYSIPNDNINIFRKWVVSSPIIEPVPNLSTVGKICTFRNSKILRKDQKDLPAGAQVMVLDGKKHTFKVGEFISDLGSIAMIKFEEGICRVATDRFIQILKF